MPNSHIAKPPADLAAFRKALRTRLIAAREAQTPEQRALADHAISRHLQHLMTQLQPRVLAYCWPFRGEFDCRALAATWHGQGVVMALPVVLDRDLPLEFHVWRPDSIMVEGRYGIAIPADSADSTPVVPDLILLPVNGFDAAGYRLGYGGGYFDRTLAALAPKSVTVGVGYELGRVASIYPQDYDARLDWLVTEAGAVATLDR